MSDVKLTPEMEREVVEEIGAVSAGSYVCAHLSRTKWLPAYVAEVARLREALESIGCMTAGHRDAVACRDLAEETRCPVCRALSPDGEKEGRDGE